MSERYKQSETLHRRAAKTLVGGVNSPVRAYKSVDLNPILIKHGEGSKVTDVDGNDYLDLVGSYGPMVLGHQHAHVQKEVSKSLLQGYSFGATTEMEIALAEFVCAHLTSCDKIRFVNSGTEATLSAIRLARAFTGRNKIIKFSGCYHGHADVFLVQAGSGLATLGIPDSKGTTANAVKDTLVAQYNDIESVSSLFQQYRNDIAAVIIEPVAGNMGIVLPEDGFLTDVKLLCEQNQALFIADEVMTGFRGHFGLACEIFGVQPDIVCLGKIVGGGFPVGAYGAREEIMNMVAPLGPVYQAGTLSGNPVAMTAGLATLTKLKALNPYEQFRKNAATIVSTIRDASEKTGIPTDTNMFGSMVHFFFHEPDVRNFSDAQESDTALFARFFKSMLDRGIFLPPSQFEAWFLNTELSTRDMNLLVQAIQDSFAEIANS